MFRWSCERAQSWMSQPKQQTQTGEVILLFGSIIARCDPSLSVRGFHRGHVIEYRRSRLIQTQVSPLARFRCFILGDLPPRYQDQCRSSFHGPRSYLVSALAPNEFLSSTNPSGNSQCTSQQSGDHPQPPEYITREQHIAWR